MSSIWLFLPLPRSQLDEGYVPSLSCLMVDSDNKRIKGEGESESKGDSMYRRCIAV